MTNDNSPQSFFQNEVSQYKKEHYGSGYRTFMSVRQERFLNEVDALDLPKEASILDAGCGPGLLTRKLYDRGFNTSAIDTSPEMLELTRELFEASETKPSIQEGNVESLPFEKDSFDMVISPGVIEYLDSDEKILAEFYRVLKPGGYMLLSVTNKLSPVGYLDFIVEAIKRNDFTRRICNKLLVQMGRTPVRPRPFKVRKHFPKSFKSSVRTSGLKFGKDGYFYVLPWPHPFDRAFPGASDNIGKKLEFISTSFLGFLAEGYYILAQKPQ